MRGNKKAILILSSFLGILVLTSLTNIAHGFIINQAPAVYDKDLKGYWNFDNKTFEVIDSSNYKNHGTLDGGIYTDGKEGNAIRFDGDNDLVSVQDDNSLNDFDEFSVVAWVKFNDLIYDDYQTIVSKSGDEPAEIKGWVLDIDLGFELKLWIYTTGWESVAYDITSLKEDKWYHVAGVYDGDELKLYVDSDKVADQEGVGTLRNSNEDLLIGADYGFDPEGFFNGTIDEVAVFDKALDSDEIEDIMDNGIEPISEGELIIDWIELLYVVIPLGIVIAIIGIAVRRYRIKINKKPRKTRSRKA